MQRRVERPWMAALRILASPRLGIR